MDDLHAQYLKRMKRLIARWLIVDTKNSLVAALKKKLKDKGNDDSGLSWQTLLRDHAVQINPIGKLQDITMQHAPQYRWPNYSTPLCHT